MDPNIYKQIMENYLKEIRKHSGMEPYSIDPRYGNPSCNMCKDMRTVAHLLKKDEGKQFTDIWESVHDEDINMHVGWFETDYYKKYSMCMECARKAWSADPPCAKCKLCIFHWGSAFKSGWHERQERNGSPVNDRKECRLEAHPECALTHYEAKYGPSANWYMQGENCCSGSKEDGTFQIIDKCLCGDELSSYDILQAMSDSFHVV